MTLDEAKAALGCKTNAELASRLAVSRQAVGGSWDPDAIPKRREYEVLMLVERDRKGGA